MGKRPGKPQTDTSLCKPPGSVRRTGPEGSALDLLQLESFSHSPSLGKLPLEPTFNLSISLPPPSSPVYSPFPFPCLLFLIAPLSHTHIPLQIIFLLEPVLMASFQEQQVWISSSLKWRQEVGEWGQEDIGSLVSIVLSVQPSPRPPGTLLSLPLPFCPDIPHITHKRRRNRVCTREGFMIPCRQNQRPSIPTPIRQLVSIRCSKPYKYSLFSLISYYFPFSFSLLFTPCLRSLTKEASFEIKKESMPNFALTILSFAPGPWQSRTQK